MQEKIILTVVIFTYNQKDTIAKCIESILNQKTKYIYQIHVCDDASTDGTSDIVRDYESKYPDKIKAFIQEENTFGKNSSDNHIYWGYKRINTKYWATIDGDDWWCDENKIETAINILEENPDCYTFAHNVCICKKSNNEKSLVVPEEFTEGIYDKNTAPGFVHVSGRVHRLIPDIAQNEIIGDSEIYLFYKVYAPIYYMNKVMSVYNWNEKGIWTSLNEKYCRLLSKMIPFRMCQFSNFQNEEYWLEMAGRNKRTINILKLFFGKKGGWYVWFAFRFIPTFGFRVLNKHYTYFQKK